MTIEANKELVRHYEVWGQGDSAADERMIAPDYVDHMPPPGIRPDRAGQRENLRLFHTAFPDARFTIDDLVAEDSTVVVRWTMRAIQQGPSMAEQRPTNHARSRESISTVLRTVRFVRFGISRMGWGCCANWASSGRLSQMLIKVQTSAEQG